MGSQQQEKHVLVERGRGVYSSVKSTITLPLVFTLCAFLCSSISMLNAVSSYTLFDCNLFGKKVLVLPTKRRLLMKRAISIR